MNNQPKLQGQMNSDNLQKDVESYPHLEKPLTPEAHVLRSKGAVPKLRTSQGILNTTYSKLAKSARPDSKSSKTDGKEDVESYPHLEKPLTPEAHVLRSKGAVPKLRTSQCILNTTYSKLAKAARPDSKSSKTDGEEDVESYPHLEKPLTPEAHVLRSKGAVPKLRTSQGILNTTYSKLAKSARPDSKSSKTDGKEDVESYPHLEKPLTPEAHVLRSKGAVPKLRTSQCILNTTYSKLAKAARPDSKFSKTDGKEDVESYPHLEKPLTPEAHVLRSKGAVPKLRTSQCILNTTYSKLAKAARPDSKSSKTDGKEDVESYPHLEKPLTPEAHVLRSKGAVPKLRTSQCILNTTYSKLAKAARPDSKSSKTDGKEDVESYPHLEKPLTPEAHVLRSKGAVPKLRTSQCILNTTYSKLAKAARPDSKSSKTDGEEDVESYPHLEKPLTPEAHVLRSKGAVPKLRTSQCILNTTYSKLAKAARPDSKSSKTDGEEDVESYPHLEKPLTPEAHVLRSKGAVPKLRTSQCILNTTYSKLAKAARPDSKSSKTDGEEDVESYPHLEKPLTPEAHVLRSKGAVPKLRTSQCILNTTYSKLAKAARPDSKSSKTDGEEDVESYPHLEKPLTPEAHVLRSKGAVPKLRTSQCILNTTYSKLAKAARPDSKSSKTDGKEDVESYPHLEKPLTPEAHVLRSKGAVPKLRTSQCILNTTYSKLAKAARPDSKSSKTDGKEATPKLETLPTGDGRRIKEGTSTPKLNNRTFPKSGKDKRLPEEKKNNTTASRDSKARSKLPQQQRRSASKNNFNNRKQFSSHPTKRCPVENNSITFSIPKLLKKQPKELLAVLTENLSDFNRFLGPPLASDEVAQFVFALEQICKLKVSPSLTNVLLSRIHKNFMKQLGWYFVKLSLDEERDKKDTEMYWADPEAFWNSLLVVLENIVDALQSEAKQLLPKIIKACLITIGFHRKTQGIATSEEIKAKLHHLNDRLKGLPRASYLNFNQFDDYYQTINVYPDPDEVLTNKKFFIRKNIKLGSYENVEHYLDTHFRLLREDFLAPLRKGISTYKASLEESQKYVKIHEFRVYPEAFFKKRRCNETTVRQRMCEPLKPGHCNQKYVNGTFTFKDESLLCFSSDNFQTMFFGLAMGLRGTEKGIVDVQLLQSVPFLHVQRYTMLECSTYFKPYCAVLKALQNIETRSLPMENYVVNVANSVAHPKYLRFTTKFALEERKFTVLDFESWPAKEELQLNEMQYAAFKHALTSEFALIQGPPGTGKTYLGLKIAQTLIENYKVIKSTSHEHCGPILIVAYTNHALDQFLEGLIPYTENIARFGSRCKNEKVARFLFRCSWSGSSSYFEQIEEILDDNEALMEELECALSYQGIFDVTELVGIDAQLENSLQRLENNETVMWLMGRSRTEHDRRQRWNMTNEIAMEFENDANDQIHYNGLRVERYCVLTTHYLVKQHQYLVSKFANKNAMEIETMFEDWNSVEEDCEQAKDNVAYLTWRLRRAEAHRKLYSPERIKANDVYNLSYNDRWILYFHCLNLHIQSLQEALQRNNSAINEVWKELEIYRQKEDSDLLAKKTVVGMTTTFAAQRQHLLKNLKCQIVIVEEAAEVLESHIVTSITKHCRHLILIGDHQQLRPSTADHEIAKKYQLGLSLFERMVLNKIPCSSLDVQHRMRPEISRLITPAIYPNLKNHDSVSSFSNIGGIMHNIFFVDHGHPEVEIGSSKLNPHEAKYVVALARHLVLQGYTAREITILTTYKGQMFEIIKRRQNCPDLQDVRVDVVDNFQGEENRIIILSLVRSNDHNSIGFLAIENRVCVALSRAKQGFYMIGNMNTLSQSSKIWPKIKEVLTDNDQVGPGLLLACQLHSENETLATNAEDFLKVPDGGCSLSCNKSLLCGHICQRKCHVTDVDHTNYKCKQSCTKILCSDNHICPKRCYEKCGPCQVLVERLLKCAHLHMVPCHTEIEEYKCPTLVETSLECGHVIQKPCFQNEDELKCPVEVEFVHPECGHTIKKECYKPTSTIRCRTIITIELKCGHDRQYECYLKVHDTKPNKTQDTLQMLTCRRTRSPAILSFTFKHKSSQEVFQYECPKRCTKLRVGCKTDHKCNLECSKPCEPCNEEIIVALPCGHWQLVKCCISDGELICGGDCRKTKSCGHICYSKCHPICSPTCFFKVFKKFPGCNHGMTMNCSEDVNTKVCFKCYKR